MYEPASEALQVRIHGLAAKLAQKLNEPSAGQVIVQPQFTGKIGDVSSGGDAIVPAIVAGN